jgi:hypothetical protein
LFGNTWTVTPEADDCEVVVAVAAVGDASDEAARSVATAGGAETPVRHPERSAIGRLFLQIVDMAVPIRH